MPTRATKRGDDRTPLDRDCDVLICGASFAGLAVARELAGSGADVMVIDRYEIGERQTSACGIPTTWLTALDLEDSLRQTFAELVIHTPHTTVRYDLPWTFSTFDYRTLCGLLWDRSQPASSPSRPPRSSAARAGCGGHRPGRDPAPLIVDALGLAARAGLRRQRPAAGRAAVARARGPSLRRAAPTSRSGSTAATSPPGTAGASPPATRCGSASARSIRAFTSRSRPTGWPSDLHADTVRYQGNWIPHALRPATEDGVFFVGDSAGHCLPLTAEGIRTALYFGLACGRELARVVRGEQTREQALARYHQFSAGHATAFAWMLRVQRLVPRVAPRLLAPALRGMGAKRFVDWSFGHYLNIAHPSFAAADMDAVSVPA